MSGIFVKPSRRVYGHPKPKNDRCWNSRCRDTLPLGSRAMLCPSCRYLARWMFSLGVFVAGAIYWAAKHL